jgi:two-component system, OmpR family, sensor histidine kinase VicK
MKIENYRASIKELGRVSPDGLFLYNLSENSFSYSNKKFRRMLGISTDIVNPSCREVIALFEDSEKKMLYSQFKKLTSKSHISNLDIRLKTGASNKYLQLDAYMLREGNVILGILKDITKIKTHFNYVVEFGARKDAILDMVAHNLSGPLNLTNNLLNLIDQVNNSVQYRKINHHSRLIRENTQRCIKIINAFLKEEHLASERIFAHETRFDAIAKIKIVIAGTRPFVEDKTIIFKSDLPELMVTGDDVKFFQVIQNLLSNACKFTQPEGKIWIKVKDNKTTFLLTVKDNGIGIPEYLQMHIFDRNTLAAREGLRGEKSIGMGLYIVQELVELMRGKISFKSVENKGSEFTVELPKGFSGGSM